MMVSESRCLLKLETILSPTTKTQEPKPEQSDRKAPHAPRAMKRKWKESIIFPNNKKHTNMLTDIYKVRNKHLP